MHKMLVLLFSNLHWIFFVWTASSAYSIWSEKQQNLQAEEERVVPMEQDLEKKKEKMKMAEIYTANRDASKARVEEVAKQIETTQRQLPNTSSDNEIRKIVVGEASEMNIKDMELTPLVEEKRDFYYAKPYAFKGVGTFLQFLVFFERLAQQQRILNIKNLEIQRPKDKTKGRFQVVSMQAEIEVYRYNTEYKMTDALDAIKAEKEPSARPRRAKRKAGNSDSGSNAGGED